MASCDLVDPWDVNGAIAGSSETLRFPKRLLDDLAAEGWGRSRGWRRGRIPDTAAGGGAHEYRHRVTIARRDWGVDDVYDHGVMVMAIKDEAQQVRACWANGRMIWAVSHPI